MAEFKRRKICLALHFAHSFRSLYDAKRVELEVKINEHYGLKNTGIVCDTVLLINDKAKLTRLPLAVGKGGEPADKVKGSDGAIFCSIPDMNNLTQTA